MEVLKTKSRINQFQNTVTKLGQENESLKQQVRLLEVTGTEELPDALLERLRSLESENAHLSQDADFQRKQYERCLDDIANQVVRALLSQKGLREEIGHLQRRIKELENQNQALANILMSKLECNGSAFALPSTDGKCHEAISGSPWYPGTFPNDASLPKEVEESSLSNCVDSLATKNGGVKRLRRLYLSDIIDRGDTNVNSVESLVVVPIQRPKSLNLHLRASPRSPTGAVAGVTTKRCQHKKNKLNSVAVASKKPTEDEGNESPESGNRDEGYSTMSSDVQGPGETSELSKRELEDLKEASDETDVILDTNGEMASIVVIEETDPDMFFIPLNLSLTINPRHSYPPHKNFLPFQRAMRSFSDSHLCLKLTGSSPVLPPVFSPSMFFVDIIDKNHPLRRTKATSSLLVKKSDVKEAEETQSCEGSSCSGVADGCWWDAEYVQHWLKLDDNRLKEQQEQREMLQIEYDRTEIEEWSMSLSCEDVAKSASDGDLSLSRRVDETTPGTLPSIRETDFTKGNSDEWTDYNYMNLRIDGKDDEKDTNWSYEENEAETKFAWQETSPRGSWSSESSNKSDDCCRSLNGSCFNECTSEVESRQSSAVSDKESNGEGEVSSTVGTDFTRDFYRLVKFESTKSLASNCSKSNGTCNLTSRNTKQSEIAQEREMALQSVLSFIAEQQRYCHNREEEDGKSEFYDERSSVNLVETADKIVEVSDLLEENELKGVTEHRIIDYRKEASMEQEDITPELSSKESYEELCNKEKDSMANSNNSGSIEFNDSVQTLSSTAAATTAATATRSLKGSRKSFERETKLPVRNSRHSTPKALREECSRTVELKRTRPGRSQKKENYNSIKLEIKESAKRSENTTSKTKITTPPEIVVMQSKSSKSPGKVRETGIPISVTKRTESSSPGKQPLQSRVPRPKVSPRSNGTRIPVVSARKSDSSKQFECGGPPKVVATGPAATETSTSKKSNSGKSLLRKSSPPKSPTSKIVCDDDSFHERATTKDVIDELNRMIRKGDEISPSHGDGELKPLDVACCCPTGWVHVERDIDFTDPKARANLLDVMLASSGSSDETESRSSSSESGADEPVDYSHLHRLHRFRRQRKASATREQLGVLRYSLSSVRPSIIGRENFFIRYGDKEREAVASFDFLEDISTTSVSGCSSCASLGTYHSSCLKSPNDPERDVDVGTPLTPTTPVTPSEDSDERTGGPVSLSDSCADSYTESVGSLEEPFTVKQFAE
ncbi:hypothetical protein RUM43_005715 [Polyplax serrata]|uniref:Nck-associated protein 5 n=1 Tax=Polyplax serrata TaxID=468196 RepID=A0AAN8NWI8_POLSC